jgi:hypothetical protein
MVMLFIESRFSKQFENRIRPVFEARGIHLSGEAFADIQRAFNGHRHVWEVCLEVPTVGRDFPFGLSMEPLQA